MKNVMRFIRWKLPFLLIAPILFLAAGIIVFFEWIGLAKPEDT